MPVLRVYASLKQGRGICVGSSFSADSERLPPDFKAYIVDLRGFGDSTYNNKIDSIKDLSDDLLAFVNNLGVKNFTMLGWSAGGSVCHLSLPFVFFDVRTAQWIIWIVLFIRGTGVGGITIPVMSDSYVGLQKPQVPAASVSTRIIQNVGAAFGSAILATAVSSARSEKAVTVANTVSAYHAGFVTSLIFMVIGILPALFLTNKLRRKKNPVNYDKES